MATQSIGNLSTELRGFAPLANEGPDAHETYKKMFHGNPLPLGLSVEAAIGPQKERLKEFFNYRVQSPMGILYKKVALNGVHLKEFSKLPVQNQNHLNYCEAGLKGTPAEKCAALAYAVQQLIQNAMDDHNRDTLYRNLFSRPGKFDRVAWRFESNYGTLSGRDPLFNPLRLFDAVYENYYLHSDPHRYQAESSYPSDAVAPLTSIGDFGTKEAFPFLDLSSSGALQKNNQLQNWLTTQRAEQEDDGSSSSDEGETNDVLPVTFKHAKWRHEVIANIPLIPVENAGSGSEAEDSFDTMLTWSHD